MKKNIWAKVYFITVCAIIIGVFVGGSDNTFITKADSRETYSDLMETILDNQNEEYETKEMVTEMSSTEEATIEETSTGDISEETTKVIQATEETATEKQILQETKKEPETVRKVMLKMKSNGKIKKYYKNVKRGEIIWLPKTHFEFVKKYPELILKGYIFKGLYRENRKVSKITSDAEVVVKWKKTKVKLKSLQVKKGKIILKFNNKDWKYIDGVKITYSTNSNFKKKATKSFYVHTKRNVIKQYIIKKKKFKEGREYFIKIQFYYKQGNKKIYYKQNRTILGVLYSGG